MSSQSTASLDIALLLPMLPWEGPPLPRFLGIRWPWIPPTQDSARPTRVEEFFRGSIGSIEFGRRMETLSENTEEMEVIRGPDGGIQRIIRQTRPGMRLDE